VERTGVDIRITPVASFGSSTVDAENRSVAALALMIVGLVSQQGLSIAGCRALSSVFPEYVEQARRIGVRLVKE
jgi:5-enolpyruvylshikimate-3-phosphate synthase